MMATTTNTSYTFSGLSPGKAYQITVRAKDNNGNLSSPVTITGNTTAESMPDTTAPVVTISPAAGTYTSNQNVTLSANEAATIYYTLDGSTPTISSTVYTSTIVVSANTTIKYFAKDTVGNASTVQSTTYTINIPDTTPPANVASVTASNLTDTSVTLSWPASGSGDVASYDIYDGNTLKGNTASLTYNVTGLTPGTSHTFWVKAKDGAGNVASGTSVDVTTTAPPDTTAPVLTMTPAANFYDTQTVTMSANEAATIYYTLDDSDPVASGTKVQYSSPLTLTDTDTVKAYAVDGSGNASTVQTVTYTKVAAAFVTNGLQAYYDFASLSTTPSTVTDSSGNGNTGTLRHYSGARGSGVLNGELVGDGLGDSISIASKPALRTYPLTLEFYSSFRRDISPDVTSFRLFSNQYGTGTGNGIGVILNTPKNATLPNTIQFSGTLSQPNYSVAFNAYDNTYHHVVVVFGQNYQKIYVDNVLLGTGSGTSTTLGDRVISLFTDSDTLSATGNSLQNSTRLFRFYNRELTQVEVTQNYNNLPTSFTPGDYKAPMITASPAPGTYTGPQTITFTTDETDGEIYYTTNNTLPSFTNDAYKYTAPFTISATTTIHYIMRDGAGNKTPDKTITYTIN
jgi:hypothetical protein